MSNKLQSASKQKKSLDELKSYIEGFNGVDSEKIIVELFFLCKNYDDGLDSLDVFKVPISRECASLIFENIYKSVEKKINSLDEIADYQQQEVYEANVLEALEIKKVDQYYLNFNQPSQIDEFDLEQDCKYENIWSYIVRFTYEDKTFEIVRRLHHSQTLKAGCRLWMQNKEMKKFDKEIFVLDHLFEAILVDDWFYIAYRTKFETAFVYQTQRHKQAHKNMQELIQKHKIVKIPDEQLELFLEKKNIVNKLVKLDLSLIEDRGLTFKVIKDFCDKEEISIGLNEAEKVFMPSDTSQMMELLRVLNDDILRSDLTSKTYRTQSKTEKTASSV